MEVVVTGTAADMVSERRCESRAALHPSAKMARHSTVEVVVPSPAMSLVLLATCRTSCAPRLWYLSLNSMPFATVTPSLVIFGAPNDCSMTTFRPLGPRVTCTASASLSTPASMSARASLPKRTSLPDMKRTAPPSDDARDGGEERRRLADFES